MKPTPHVFKSSLISIMRQEEVSTYQFIISNEYIFSKLTQKFTDVENNKLAVSLRETLRFLHLSARANRPLFFPGDQLVDDLWHFFITETLFYEELCFKLGAGEIIHHSGLEYTDYKEMLPQEALQEEHLSWLASYIQFYKKIDEYAFNCLPMARQLSSRYKLSLAELNDLGNNLIEAVNSSEASSCRGWSNLILDLETQVKDLDYKPHLVGAAIHQIISEIRGLGRKDFRLTNKELKDVFGASLTLGFTLWQHLAAVERLEQNIQWQNSNSSLWAKINAGEVTVGLGITHLAKLSSPLTGERQTDQSYIVNGLIPWISGYDFYDFFIVGFTSESNNVVTIVEASELFFNDSNHPHRIELEALGGTGSVSLEIIEFKIPQAQVLSVTEIGKPTRASTSEFIFPEIGVAHRVLREVEKNCINQISEKNATILASKINLEDGIFQFEKLSLDLNNNDYFELQIIRDELIRDSIKLLTLSEGGRALSKKGLSNLYAKQMLLLDVFIQPQSLVEKKNERLRR